MRNKRLIRLLMCLPVGALILASLGCERDIEDLSPVSNPTNPEVFINTFSPGLIYAAFGGSVLTAFQVDSDVTYNNTSTASMRFEVPDAGDSRGAYAGGAYFTASGRDLSGYDVLTFWAKGSQAANIDVIGFGIDLAASPNQTSITGLPITTNWKKYYIPLPDPSKLTNERGMFYYSEGPENGRGYTFWVDDVKFEKLGTVAHPRFTILNGQDQVVTSFVGVTQNIAGLSAVFNLPDGTNQAVNIAPNFFEFATSDPSIATVNSSGVVTVVGGPGEATITATVGGVAVDGSLRIVSVGNFQPAPTPTRDPATVISIFSERYPNVPVNYYNGYWAPFQTTQSADFSVAGDNILHYTNFNFVGIEFSAPVVNATTMTHLHVDLYLPSVPAGTVPLRMELVNFGDGGTGIFRRNITPAQSQQWISLDIPLTDFTGLTGRANLAQIIFADDSGNLRSFYADNIYFYNGGGGGTPTGPTTAAPLPTHPASGVTSVFSNSYTNIPNTDLNPNWGQATVATQVAIQGNNTLRYGGLNYQGIALGASTNVSARNFLHIDYWSTNSTALNVYLISPGPVETPFVLTVPTPGIGWRSVDIPLSSFSPVNLTDVIQLKFDGNGDIYLDNIYFRN